MIFLFTASGCKGAPTQELVHDTLFSVKPADMSITHLDFSNDGSLLVASPNHATVEVMDVGSGNVIGRHEFEGTISKLQFIENDQVFIAKRDGSVEVWDSDLTDLFKAHTFPSRASAASLSDDAQWGFYGPAFFSWTGEVEKQFDLTHAGINGFMFFGTDYGVSFGAHDGAIGTIDLSTLARSEWQASDKIVAGEGLNGQAAIVFATKDDMLYCFDVASEKVRYQFPLSSPVSIVTDPDGKWFAAVYKSKALFFDVLTGEQFFEIPFDFSWSSLAASPGRLFVGGRAGSLHVVDLDEEKIETAKFFDQADLWALEWHEKTGRLAIGSSDGDLTVIRLQGGGQSFELDPAVTYP